MYWFKRKIRQIKRTIEFLPLIWNSYDFDYSYALDLFKKQLERIADNLETNPVGLSAPIKAQKIRTAIRLMDKVYNEEYAMEYMDTIDKLYGTTHYDFIDTGEESKHSGEKVYTLKVTNERAINEEHQNEIEAVRNEMMKLSNDKQKKAHKLLWKFLEHNIERWWD